MIPMLGAEGAGGSIQVVVGLSTRECYLVAERQGRLRPPRREVGLALFGVRGYLTRLTRSLYLI